MPLAFRFLTTLVLVGLIAAFVFQQKQKRNGRGETETAVDENPVYGEYEQYENGDILRQTTIEVIDSSPYYGETTEEWDGANITDTNVYYA